MDKDSEKMLLEILKMARELVINEYVDRRAQDHNSWLYESQKLWSTRRIRLQYPTIPPYPTETEIVERAQTLLKFLILGNQESKMQEQVVPQTESLKDETQDQKSIAIAEEQEQIKEVIEEEALSSETSNTKIDEIAQESTGRILPTVLRQIEKIKNKF